MGDVVNLRRARKEHDRRAREAEAEANRIAFGRTKAERKLSEAEAKLTRERLDGHRLETPGSGSEPNDA
jgi:hypothetical protein